MSQPGAGRSSTLWQLAKDGRDLHCRLEHLADGDWVVRVFRNRHLLHACRWSNESEAMASAERCRLRYEQK